MPVSRIFTVVSPRYNDAPPRLDFSLGKLSAKRAGKGPGGAILGGGGRRLVPSGQSIFAAGARSGAGLALALLAAGGFGTAAASSPASSPTPDREAWRKVESGNVTVVGTASDARLVETAITIRALSGLLSGLVPGAFGPPPPLVVAMVHDAAHLGYVGLPVGLPPGGPAGARVVLPATSDEEARADLLRAAVRSIALRANLPLPAWFVSGLSEYLSTFTAAGGRATFGHVVPEHVARLGSSPLPAGRPALFALPEPRGNEAAADVRRAEAWAVVHLLLHALPDGGERIARYARLLAEGRGTEIAFHEAFGEPERAFLARARARAVGSRPIARFVALPPEDPAAPEGVGRILPLTRAGAAGVLGGIPRGRRAPSTGAPTPASAPGREARSQPALSSGTFGSGAARPGAPRSVTPDVPAEVDLVNRLIDEGREEEALARLEALHASLGRDPEMQRALGWDVAEVRRVVVHNRLVKRYNLAIGLLNAGRLGEALAIFREVAGVAEDPGLRRLAWERATDPAGGRR